MAAVAVRMPRNMSAGRSVVARVERSRMPEPLAPDFAPSALHPGYKLGRGLRLAPAEPPVERVALAGHFDEELRRLEAGAVFLLARLHHVDDALGAEHVDPGKRAPGVGRKAEAEDRAHIRLAHVDPGKRAPGVGRK